MLRKDGSKVDRTEFITGSAAQQWWSTQGNNPASFPTGTPYSILIPDEDLRLQLEVLDPTGHKTVYFGITLCKNTNCRECDVYRIVENYSDLKSFLKTIIP